MRFVFIIIAATLNFNAFAFNFSSLFHTHKHKHRKVVAKAPTYVDAKGDFEKYCIKKEVAYGVQISCTKTDEPVVFKFDASGTVKCKQKVKGLSNVYPGQVDIPNGFIKQMKICPNAKIFGPNILHKVNVTESGVSAMQRNQTETYYDVVCHDDSTYQAAMYKNQQSKYDKEINDKLTKCEHQEVAVMDSLKYILIFKILVALAVVSFILRFYFKYRNLKK
ncbi:MAG: hypothetical protein K0R14_547 [Burkholderiales bacterium]|jgi:hypothetical protein|nr:hypothetical protein [Burkholderiales bacterium]